MNTRRGPWLTALVTLLLTGCTSWGVLSMQGASPIAFTGTRVGFSTPLAGSFGTQEKCQEALVAALDTEMHALDPKVYAATRVNPNTIKRRTLASGQEVYLSYQCAQR